MDQDDDVDMGAPPATPPSPSSSVDNTNTASTGENTQSTIEANTSMNNGDSELPATPPSPPSPTSAQSVSASAVSATDQNPSMFAEMSTSVDNTSAPRYLSRYANDDENEDDVEAELRRMAQRQLPRGDLGRSEWRIGRQDDDMNAEVNGNEQTDGGDAPLPRPPASPTSSAPSEPHSPPSFSASARTARDNEQSFNGAVVWGTNISVAESMQLFRDFVHAFRGRDTSGFHGDTQYLHQLRQLAMSQSSVLDLDAQHLIQYPPTRKLYNQLVLFPQVLIRILDMVIQEEYRTLAPSESEEESLRLQVRPFNLRDQSPMRSLNPSDIDQLVRLKGMVTRCSALIPDLKEAFFRCGICHYSTTVALDRGRIDEPGFCERCNSRASMEMIHNRCAFTDKQLIKMQETPDAIPEGETPYTVMLFAFDDLVDAVRPGDKVEVTGIYRAVPLRNSSRQRVVKSVFKTYVDVVHFRRVDELSRADETPSTDVTHALAHASVDGSPSDVPMESRHGFSPYKVQEFERIARHPNVYQNLAESLAPSIWEMDDVKKGILCMLFGGTRKDRHGNTIRPSERDESTASGPLASKSGARADVNVLLCGDPGTSKSQLLSYVHKLSPRSIYTSGKGSSAVGLTASVVRDAETGDLVLESGALVLSDEGVCCIDEFDKMSDSARGVLHEVMEQQTVSLAKAGIICSLNARASILASANPIESRYNPNKSVIENVNVLPTLLSRFDLIYLLLDKPQPESDRRLAKHIVSLYYDRANGSRSDGETKEIIPMATLTEYIAYTKKQVHPRLSAGAREALLSAYLDLRRLGGRTKKTITATPRQLESLIRLSEALARMKLAESVGRADVDEALRLMNVATQRSALDPRTGTIDMDLLQTGHSGREREATQALLEDVRNVLTEHVKRSSTSITISELRKLVEENANGSEVGTSEFQAALRALEADGLIQVAHGQVRYLGDVEE